MAWLTSASEQHGISLALVLPRRAGVSRAARTELSRLCAAESGSEIFKRGLLETTLLNLDSS